MLHFVFLTFLPQKNHGVVSGVTGRHTGPRGLYGGASHLPALLILHTHPAPFPVFTLFGTLCMAYKVKMRKQPFLLGQRSQRSPSQQRAAPGRWVSWFPSRNLQCSRTPGHGGLVSHIDSLRGESILHAV